MTAGRIRDMSQSGSSNDNVHRIEAEREEQDRRSPMMAPPGNASSPMYRNARCIAAYDPIVPYVPSNPRQSTARDSVTVILNLVAIRARRRRRESREARAERDSTPPPTREITRIKVRF